MPSFAAGWFHMSISELRFTCKRVYERSSVPVHSDTRVKATTYLEATNLTFMCVAMVHHTNQRRRSDNMNKICVLEGVRGED